MNIDDEKFVVIAEHKIPRPKITREILDIVSTVYRCKALTLDRRFPNGITIPFRWNEHLKPQVEDIWEMLGNQYVKDNGKDNRKDRNHMNLNLYIKDDAEHNRHFYLLSIISLKTQHKTDPLEEAHSIIEIELDEEEQLAVKITIDQVYEILGEVTEEDLSQSFGILPPNQKIAIVKPENTDYKYAIELLRDEIIDDDFSDNEYEIKLELLKLIKSCVVMATECNLIDCQ